MAEVLEAYLDRVMATAQLNRSRKRIVRAELKDHLAALIEASNLTNPTEILHMLEKEFGNPEQIGLTLQPRRRFARSRRLIVRIAVAAMLLAGVRAAVAEPFLVPTDAAAPQVPAGSRCLVYKRASSYQPGDVIVFRHDIDHTNWIGIVKEISDTSNAVTVARHDRPAMTVLKSEIVGRIIANTR